MPTDHESETDAVVEAFYEHIGAPIRARHEELVEANRHLEVDEPARHNVRMTLALVAAYEHLEPELGRERAIETIRKAFVEPLGRYVREGTRAMLDAAPDPFEAMVAVAKARESTSFGAGFTFRHPVDDGTRFFQDVHRCHYHDVLVANGAAELTPVMCAFDANWIEAIDPPEHGFRFDRATTIGLGGTHCPFHFSRYDVRSSQS
ncbi:L-2-amino-thiazoline-4-carboxylic acid hydrolase [Amycolatopsis mongoliensis]|uniref:L-2-amino-thiazoline-4-carboxylic acid hydrolase n=1 Tax=Amycolatopsis mongoliensis TaxID=715475 RepID=A0A9Y2JZ10_9PSEU|nr:L-2-amino-thiazoline-4-carboxylic acid hydrolase [Amycolatopsis sp. 4-36]WIY06127.1 L-2-amino-thiazoline-4-carboxylic acid hydrolase [Amycolatopsis sp. 4-36]